MKGLRIAGFLFLLSLFIFPQVERALHNLSHAGEASCSQREVHICEFHHSCKVCDEKKTTFFQFSVVSEIAERIPSGINRAWYIELFPTPSALCFSPPRAPPIA